MAKLVLLAPAFGPSRITGRPLLSAQSLIGQEKQKAGKGGDSNGQREKQAKGKAMHGARVRPFPCDIQLPIA
jgi:hypothetical protein